MITRAARWPSRAALRTTSAVLTPGVTVSSAATGMKVSRACSTLPMVRPASAAARSRAWRPAPARRPRPAARREHALLAHRRQHRPVGGGLVGGRGRDVQQVGAGAQGLHGRPRRLLQRGHRGVGQVAGQRHALEAHLAPQQSGHDPSRQRGRRDEVVVGVQAVGHHDARDAGVDRGLERHRLLALDLPLGQPHVGRPLGHRLRGRAQPGEVPRRGEHLGLAVAHGRELGVAGHVRRAVGEGQRAHGHAVRRADVQDRRQHAVHAQRPQRRGRRAPRARPGPRRPGPRARWPGAGREAR